MSMTHQELEELARAGEAERVERKPSAKQKNDIRDAICAFSNDLPGHDKPGVVFVGVNDDGSCANPPVTGELLRELADLRSDGNVLPPPTMPVEKRTVQGCEVAVIVVQPSGSPPVRVRGRTMIRVGTRRGLATIEEERRLVERARSRVTPFDISPVHGATIDDLDIDFLQRSYLPAAVAREILDRNERSVDAQLQALELVTSDGTPTVLGILVASKEPTRWLPDAYVQFVRYDRMGLADPIRTAKEARGPIGTQVRFTEEVMEAQIETAIVPGPVESRVSDYPLAAFREILRNAVLHRSYEHTGAPVHVRWFRDRVEVLSPGGPFGKVTKDNFGTSGLTAARNPNLAEAMRHLGLAQRFGAGLAIARDAMIKNGNPPPGFTVTDTHVLATLRRRP